MPKESDLIIRTSGFTINEGRFDDGDITNLYLYYVNTKKSMNLIPSGNDHSAVLKIGINGMQKPINIEAGAKYFYLHGLSMGKNSSESLLAKYEQLAKRTFMQRAEKYARYMRDFGYFKYDDKRIYANGDVTNDIWKANFGVDKPWLKRPFQIFHEKKAPSFLRSGTVYAIETTTDSDVFFSIMSSLYGMRWK